ERGQAAYVEAYGGGNHLLLGDVHLEEAVRVHLGEEAGERRVGDLAVHRHDIGTCRAERGKRLAVGAARRLHGSELVRGKRRLLKAVVTRLRLVRRCCNPDTKPALPSEL